MAKCSFCGREDKCRVIDSNMMCPDCFKNLRGLRAGSLEAFLRKEDMCGSETARAYLDQLIERKKREGIYTEEWLDAQKQLEEQRKKARREAMANGDMLPMLEALSREVSALRKQTRLIFAVAIGELLLGGLTILSILLHS